MHCALSVGEGATRKGTLPERGLGNRWLVRRTEAGASCTSYRTLTFNRRHARSMGCTALSVHVHQAHLGYMQPLNSNP